MTTENKHGSNPGNQSSETKGHQGTQGGFAQDGHHGLTNVVQPPKIDGGYQGPTSQNAPKNPPSGGSSGSKK